MDTRLILLILEFAIWVAIGVFDFFSFKREDCPKEEMELEYWLLYSLFMLGLISQFLEEIIR